MQSILMGTAFSTDRRIPNGMQDSFEYKEPLGEHLIMGDPIAGPLSIMSFGMVLFLLYQLGQTQKEIVKINETLKRLLERDEKKNNE